MKHLLIILIAAITYSCTCERKLDKVLRKCPSLIKGDTITIIDTVVVNGIETDTVFNYRQTDTVILKDGNLIMKYFYNTHDSTVYLYGKCDTVYVPVKYDVPTNTIIDEETTLDWKWFIVLLAAAIVLFLAVKKLFG